MAKIEGQYRLSGRNPIKINWRGGATAAPLRDVYRQLVARAHARGVAVYGATILPFCGFAEHTPAREAVRQELNEWIRAGNVFDGVVDFDAKVREPADEPEEASGPDGS